MAWHTSTRRTHLPADWPDRRRQARQRAGGICEVTTNGERCTKRGTECHHLGDPDDHSIEKLQWICTPHHKIETQRQAQAARRALYIDARRRDPEPHPGMIDSRP